MKALDRELAAHGLTRSEYYAAQAWWRERGWSFARIPRKGWVLSRVHPNKPATVQYWLGEGAAIECILSKEKQHSEAEAYLASI